MLGTNFLTYALTRVSSGELELEALSILSFILMTSVMLIFLIIQYQKCGKKIIIQNPGLIHMANIYLILFFFIIANIARPEMAARFFFYSYFFFPIALSLLFKLFKHSLSIIQFPLILILITYFINRLEYGTWSYASLDKLIFGNLFSFII